MIDARTLRQFAVESNQIEGIHDILKDTEHAFALERLLSVDQLLTTHQQQFVHAVQPDAQFRSLPGLDVRVGNHYPPRGGPAVLAALRAILHDISTNFNPPYVNHQRYETLHPYTDGNGRSGRALWLWQMHKYYGYKGQRLFLHEWYYQSLDNGR